MSEAILAKSGALNDFVEPKPQGASQAETGERGRGIPGYGGHVPVKDFVLGQTYGAAVKLAPGAEDAIRSGARAEQLPGLVERRPTFSSEPIGITFVSIGRLSDNYKMNSIWYIFRWY